MLGATLYYLLTGRIPVSAMLRREGSKLDFTRITDKVKLDRRLRDVISVAMELKPSKRPESVRAWLKLLGFEVAEATGEVYKPSKAELSYREAELKVTHQKLSSFHQKLLIVGTLVTLVTVILGLPKFFQEIKNQNEPSYQIKQE
jgi:serine/threonine protein kinase